MAGQKVVWSEEQQRFVPVDDGPQASPRPPSAPAGPDKTRIQSRPPAGAPGGSTPAASRSPHLPRPEPPPPAVPAAPGRKGSGRRRAYRTAVRAAALVLALGLVSGLGVVAFAWWQFQRLDRVETEGALSAGSGSGTNYLIVGSDSREGIDPDDPNAGAFLGQEVSGARTDTIMVLRVAGDETLLLSVPRDLWVTYASSGESGRINAAYQSGPAELIRTVHQSLGIPIHHYLEIDFVSFGSLVDAVGGTTIEFEHPARDPKSGLDVPQSGPVTLDGAQALAYVRSRTYTELIDGTWVTDPTADIGRTERQRAFLTTLLHDVASTRNPFELPGIASSLSGGMRIDDTLSFWDAVRLAWHLKGASPESVSLPTTGFTTSGGASVLELGPGAEAVLSRFG